MRIGSLFSGAGGLDRAVEEVFSGTVAWQSEIDPAASKVLAHRFPGVPNLGDITAVDWADVPPVDVLCGGFPCQDVSAAGKRAGIKDGTRSGLWSVFAEAIDALRPQWVVVENVRGLLSATAHRTEVDDDERNCICGWLDRWRGLHRLGRQGEAWEGADVPGACCGGDDNAGSGSAAMASPGVGRIAEQLAASNGQMGVCVDVDGSRLRCAALTSADCALLEDQISPSAASPGSGADKGGPSSASEWYGSGMEFARACRVRGDQDEDALPQRQGAKCESCGGFIFAVAADSDLELGEAALGNPGDGFVLRAAGAVLGDLSDLGYDAQWTTLAASAVGAPHRRERVFILGTAAHTRHDAGCTEQFVKYQEQACGTGQSSDRVGESAGFVGGSDVAVSRDGDVALLPTPQAFDRVDHVRSPEKVAETDGGCRNLREIVVNELLPTPNASDGSGGGQHPDKRDGHSRQLIDYVLLCTPSASDGTGGKTSRSGGRIDEPLLGGQAREMATAWGKYEAAIRRWEAIVGPAPAPTEPNKNGNPRLSSAFSQWLMGWPAGWVTDPAIGISRNDQLRIVGNGVCSQQAVAALRYLLSVCEVAA